MPLPAVSPACEALLLDDLRRRTAVRGSSKRVAWELNIDQARISCYLGNRYHIPEHVAWRMLARIRQEDLALADKIEAELTRPSRLKERA